MITKKTKIKDGGLPNRVESWSSRNLPARARSLVLDLHVSNAFWIIFGKKERITVNTVILTAILMKKSIHGSRLCYQITFHEKKNSHFTIHGSKKHIDADPMHQRLRSCFWRENLKTRFPVKGKSDLWSNSNQSDANTKAIVTCHLLLMRTIHGVSLKQFLIVTVLRTSLKCCPVYKQTRGNFVATKFSKW